MKNILYLASQSSSRHQLLTQARINFKVIDQSANELEVDHSQPLAELVQAIALHKMNNLVLSKTAVDSKRMMFVLTADTLSQDSHGVIHGKPVNHQDAVHKIKALRGWSTVSTGFCVDKKIFKDNKWQVVERIVRVVQSECFFEIPDSWIAEYIDSTPALSAAGALIIEDFGALFLKEIKGSYSSILGLPLFEVRQALEKLGFFD